MSTVWVPKASGHDLRSAEKHGSLRFIFSPSDNVFDLDCLRDTAERVLSEFQAGDYLAMSGPLSMCLIAFEVLTSEWEEVALLLFHAKLEKYLARVYRRPQRGDSGAPRSDRQPA